MSRDAESFQVAYRELEERMRALAKADGDIFLPNPEPNGPVEYVLICMEPSLGGRSASELRAKVKEGFRNFLNSIEDFILHFSVRRYLCGPGQRYHITDFSKGAMPADDADRARRERYNRWYPLLKEEIDLVAAPNAGIIAVGKAVAEELERQGLQRTFTRVIHYSPQAARARNAGIEGHEDSFQAFEEAISLEDVLATAEDVLRASSVPTEICKETLSRLERRELTTSRKKLIFNYKLAFESM